MHNFAGLLHLLLLLPLPQPHAPRCVDAPPSGDSCLGSAPSPRHRCRCAGSHSHAGIRTRVRACTRVGSPRWPADGRRRSSWRGSPRAALRLLLLLSCSCCRRVWRQLWGGCAIAGRPALFASTRLRAAHLASSCALPRRHNSLGLALDLDAAAASTPSSSTSPPPHTTTPSTASALARGTLAAPLRSGNALVAVHQGWRWLQRGVGVQGRCASKCLRGGGHHCICCNSVAVTAVAFPGPKAAAIVDLGLGTGPSPHWRQRCGLHAAIGAAVVRSTLCRSGLTATRHGLR